MLMTPITPKVMARPMAASSSTEPSESPYQAFCTVFQIASVVWILPRAAVAAACTCGDWFRRQAVEQAERVLIAAVADHGDGGDLVGIGRFVVGEHDGGVRLVHRLLDARVLLCR